MEAAAQGPAASGCSCKVIPMGGRRLWQGDSSIHLSLELAAGDVPAMPCVLCRGAGDWRLPGWRRSRQTGRVPLCCQPPRLPPELTFGTEQGLQGGPAGHLCLGSGASGQLGPGHRPVTGLQCHLPQLLIK